MTMPLGKSKVIIALDFDSMYLCETMLEKLDPRLCRIKVGKEMFTLFGPRLIETLHTSGFEVFLDLKFHDIPSTVAKAVRAAASMGVWMVNVHASGGRKMMSAAADELSRIDTAPLLIAVTVLTSMTSADLLDVGIKKGVEDQVGCLAGLSRDCGLDGVVCSALEVKKIKEDIGPSFLCVTPGIRPASSASGDQQRIMTPRQAVLEGSDYLVIGRPVTEAKNPVEALNLIYSELSVT